ncbi:NlpC/P60 family protein [Rhizobiales bacterium GAS188]|nr:NlpC/P60 family protein [Rhizobiales bacterium GAS188]
MAGFDKRLTAARADLAAAHLKGKVEAERYVEPRPMRVSAASAPLRRAPGKDAMLDTEALFGETVDVYEVVDGCAWGQLRLDGYVGYLPEAALAAPRGQPTHRVATLRSYAFPGPDIKMPPVHLLSFGSLLEVTGSRDAFLVTAEGLHLWVSHLAPLDLLAQDYVAIAERFLGTPYLWGGRTSLGLDCSALVQLAMTAAGYVCPRDSDMQERIGEPAEIDADLSGLRRGDRIHWKGHVGIMLDASRLLHANGFHMRVEIETLRQARDRIARMGGGEITAIRRSGRADKRPAG